LPASEKTTTLEAITSATTSSAPNPASHLRRLPVGVDGDAGPLFIVSESGR
jgi:hypothetical protein